MTENVVKLFKEFLKGLLKYFSQQKLITSGTRIANYVREKKY
jgi:hypothetical protein